MNKRCILNENTCKYVAIYRHEDAENVHTDRSRDTVLLPDLTRDISCTTECQTVNEEFYKLNDRRYKREHR